MQDENAAIGEGQRQIIAMPHRLCIERIEVEDQRLVRRDGDVDMLAGLRLMDFDRCAADAGRRRRANRGRVLRGMRGSVRWLV